MEQVVNITIDKHHALPFKILRRFVDALLIILLLAATFLAITPIPGHAQGIEEVVLYEENFNDNQAQDWELEQGWTVTEGTLSGSGHEWARCTAGEWSDYRVNFQLQLLEEGSTIHLNYRLSEKGRYYIGFHEGGLYLSKEAPFGTFHEILAKSSISNEYNEWYNVEIIGEGPRIQVIVEDKLELDYTDLEPLLSGTIAFETLEGAVAQVDDIIVIGPSPTQKGPDLAILSTDYWFEDDERVLVLLVEIVNQGNNEAPETQVFVGDIEHDWLNEYSLIQDLGPEDTISVEIRLDIPEELRGTMVMFRVEVDPEDAIREIDEENNEVMTPRIQLPLSDYELPLLHVIVTLGAIGGFAFTIHRIIKIRRHNKWENKAQEEEPQEMCQPSTRYCRKIELELEPALLKITHLSFGAYDPVSGEQSKEMQVRGELVEGLNKAVMAHRRREKPEKLLEQVAPLAYTLLQQIIEWVHGESIPRDVFVTGHLEGSKVTSQFILYHCKRRGTVNVWEEEEKWKATISDERIEFVGTLRGIEPTEFGIPKQVAYNLTHLLKMFIEKV